MAMTVPPQSFSSFSPTYNAQSSHPAQFQPRPGMLVPLLSEEELNMKPRPHPHLPSATIYIDHIPQDVEETVFVGALRDCMPMRIKFSQAVPPNVRLQPDLYYDWMPKSGTITFEDMYHVEKAMAILFSHPSVFSRGISVSPFQRPHTLPFSQATGRYIRPKRQILTSSTTSSDPTEQFMEQCPTPGELFDAVRTWGSVRALGVWMENALHDAPSTWGARIEFWYEDEARRFEIGFGQTANHIKGWQVEIHPELLLHPPRPIYASGTVHQYPFNSHFPDTGNLPTSDGNPYIPADMASDLPFPVFPLEHLGVTYHPMNPMLNLPDSSVPSTPIRGGHRRLSSGFARTTPPLVYTPPWSSHNPYTIKGTDMPPAGSFPLSPPQTARFGMPSTPGTPTSGNDLKSHGRHRSNSSRTSISSVRQNRARTWSLTIDEGPMGDIRPTGLIADDGTVIAHGPGQHIRPAPPFGPGSTSSSGLVDYSNVFVKNLDPDINSVFLAEFFAPIGRIVSARVMRDEQNRSRGYGFVSFHTPEEASAAIHSMNGQRLGKQFVAVTLHEPRKLRPEKIAERMAMGSPTAYGRQAVGTRRSSSPSRFDRRQRLSRDESRPPGTTDDIRLLSPESRKHTLSKRVTPAVTRFARLHSVPEAYCQTTIKALVDHDLQLIPLLYNHSALDAKISETMSVLQSDPELDMDLDETRMQPNEPSTQSEIENLRGEISRIDPSHADAILMILLKQLNAGDIQSCLSSKIAMVQRYNEAKKELREQLNAKDEVAKEQEVAPEAIPLPPSDAPAGSPAPFDRVDLETVTLDQLAALGSRDILANIEGDDGNTLLNKLGIGQPSPHEQARVEKWTRTMMEKSIVERKMEMTTMTARKLDASMKRSQKLKIAREIVNAETDDEALCHLMAYPAIIQAKVQEFA